MITSHAKYSVTLHSLLQSDTIKAEINKALSTYPLYRGKKDYDLIPTRESLNEKIINHYKYREIGFETIGRFLDELEITMKEIMPHYNELFKTVETMADLPNPFDNVDVVETYEETRHDKTESEGTNTENQNGTAENTSTGNGSSINTRKFSDTPQNRVDSIDKYLSEYEETNGESEQTTTENLSSTNTNTATGSNTSETNGTTQHTYTKKGNQGVNTYAHDMNEFRTSIIDVVEQIINDKRLESLFMLVW